MGTRTRIGLAVVIPMLVAGVPIATQLVRSAPLPSHSIAHAHQIVPDHTATIVDERDDTDPPVDLYGNEVTDAVAKYKLDATGMLYELHSPQTELPRLGSPKS